MARHGFETTLTDQYGRIIVGGTVTVNLTGTSTAATIYAAESGGSAITDSQITTGSDGSYKFWVDESDHASTQKFRLVLAGGSPFTTRTIDDVVVFPGITASSTETFTNKTIDADNNTISNLVVGSEVSNDFNGSDVNNAGVMFLTEQAAAETNVGGKGQIWVKTATPNTLQFSDDIGTDFVLVHRSDKLDVFAATTSAELAGVISDETGSGGGFVRATSPTLVAPVLGDASGTSLTLTGTTETDTNTLTKNNIVKGWIDFDPDGTVNASYNATVSDNAVGDWTVNWTTDFGSVNYAVVAFPQAKTTARLDNVMGVDNAGKTAGVTELICVEVNDATAESDADKIYCIAIGDQ